MPNPDPSVQASNPGKAAMSVLAIRQGNLRDMILAIGALKAIRDAHPRAKLTVATCPETEAFAKLCPFIDEVISDLNHEDKKRRTNRIAELRRDGIDIVYDLDGTRESSALFQAFKPRFGSPPPWSGPAPGAALPTPAHAPGTSEVERLSRQLIAAGTAPQGSEVHPDLAWVRPVLGDPPRLQPAYFGITGAYALIALSGEKPKSAMHWPKIEVEGLCQRLADAGVTPVLTGPTQAGPMAQSIEMETRIAKNITTRADASQLIALAETASVVIGPDGAAIQAGGLMGTPCIMLRADTAPLRQDAPLTPQKIILHDARLETLTAETVWRTMSMWNLFPNARAS
ncbi:MAG: hypothetical protein MRY64_00930 [Hyphomonadaceae bacterium]|nr:hypothetical protein [Hyphomonadaceae bacterium]